MLHAFLDHHRSLPWRFGEVDCCLFLADWAAWRGHQGAADHLRGRYRSAAEWIALAASYGGLVATVQTCTDSIGWGRTRSPEIGTIAVVGSAAIPERQWGAIFDGSRWLIRTQNAETPILPIQARALAMWDI